MKNKFKYLIIGAGPAGLGAAWYLSKKGIDDWIILEKENYPGGLAASFTNEKGFVWDLGGHVIFANNEEFVEVVKKVLGKNLRKHQRRAAIFFKDSFVPYPFQDNIHFLPKDLAKRCLEELKRSDLAATQGRTLNKKKNFKEWLYATFGKTLAELFFLPLNEKSWAFPLQDMSFSWIEKRIKLPDLASTGSDPEQRRGGWGGNSQFYYPKKGGIGILWQRIAKKFKGKIKFRSKVTRVDICQKRVFLANGQGFDYQYLISTMPLDLLLKSLVGIKRGARSTSNAVEERAKGPLQEWPLASPGVKELASGISLKWKGNRLHHNSGFIIGLGIRGKLTHNFHWIYYPDKIYPFYRLVFPSNFGDVPKSYCSIMVEISLPAGKKIDNQQKQKIIKQIKNLSLFKGKIISIFTKHVEYFYPIPTLDRDKILTRINKFLHQHQIFSIGRFGGWRYEEGNMEDGFLASCKICHSFENFRF